MFPLWLFAILCHALHSGGGNKTKLGHPGSALASAIRHCYAFDVCDVCDQLETWEVADVEPWLWKRTVLRNELSPDLVKLLEGQFHYDEPPSINFGCGNAARPCDWMAAKLQAVRPNHIVKPQHVNADWVGRQLVVRVAPLFPVNATTLAAVKPCEHAFIEHWTDAEHKIFADYGFTTWRYHQVACPRRV